jgi:hypothetical protein
MSEKSHPLLLYYYTIMSLKLLLLLLPYSQPEKQSDMRLITTCLHMMITFTSCTHWKILQGKTGIYRNMSPY